MKTFLIITAYDLPEAFFLVDKLAKREQDVHLLNIERRPFKDIVRVFFRLLKRRGVKYIFGYILRLTFLDNYKDPKIVPFPELDKSKIDELKNLINYYQCKDVNGDYAESIVTAVDPDFILIAGAPVIKENIYGKAKTTTINRHLGISPLYRGSDCPIWAMSRNDFDNFGFTIHEVNEKVDGGLVLLQEQLSIDSSDFSQMLAKINRKGSEGYWSVIEKILSGQKIEQLVQGNSGQHYPPATLEAIKMAIANLKSKVQNSG